jgi:hypothetical protein
MPLRPTRIQDVHRFWRLWHDESLTTCDIARALGVSESTVRSTASRFGLTNRDRPHDWGNETYTVEPEEDLASCESLRLAPSVAAAAAEVRSKWTDEERYSRRVQKVQPVVVQSFSFARCEQ